MIKVTIKVITFLKVSFIFLLIQNCLRNVVFKLLLVWMNIVQDLLTG